MNRATGPTRTPPSVPKRSRQGGLVLILYMMSLLAVIGMAGFAIDLGQVYLAKTQLQNAVDAAALEAAVVLHKTGSTGQASAAATNSLNQNFSGLTAVVTFSDAYPFGGGAVNPQFVRVAVPAHAVPTTLSQVFGAQDTNNIDAAAIAGPQAQGGELCGAPVGMCGTDNGDSNCADGNGCFGIGTAEQALKEDPVGPGNYGLMDMGNGANAIADAFAGVTQFCAKAGDVKPTEPGKKNGTSKAMNTRFNDYSGSWSDPLAYPADVVTNSPMSYAQYETVLAAGSGSWSNPDGIPRRRTILVPVVDCSNFKGKSSATVYGMACIFLTRSVPTSGSDSGTIYVEIISDPCLSTGTPGGAGSGAAAKIVLYQANDQA